MPVRGWLAVVGAAIVFAFLMSMAAVASLAATVPPAVGGACLVWAAIQRPAASSSLAWLTVVPGAVSLASSVAVLLRDQEMSRFDGLYGLLEVGVLFVLLAATVRWLAGTKLWVCGAVTATAQVAWILRFLPERDPWSLIAGCAAWSVPSVLAVVVGGYPRVAAARLRNSVAHARSEQRRALERDIHDYVAHDLTGMIVQAQAAQYAAGDDPDQLRSALRRIEESGQRAMSSMDRALDLLGQEGPADAGTARRRPGLEELSPLVANFRGEGERAVMLSVSGDPAELPREVSEALYRVCVEALTNVRRHAPNASRVRIAVVIAHDRASLTVDDDGGSATAARRPSKGGSGLRELRGRIEALGGSFTAVPHRDGWHVGVEVPMR